MSTLLQDVRYALRQMRRSPGFTFTAVLTLAIGIGATTAIFTLMDSILLKSLPVSDPARLYRIGDTNECCEVAWGDDDWSIYSLPLVRRFAEAAPEFQEVTAFSAAPRLYGIRSSLRDQQSRAMHVEYVEGNYFNLFGVGALAGRTLQPSDDTVSAPPAVVMSYHAWQQSYGGDLSLVGSTFLLEGHPVTLVGIAPPGFYGDTLRTDPPEFWIPIHQELLIDGPDGVMHNNNGQWLYAIGRLKPGASVEGLGARLTSVLQRWLRYEDQLPAMYQSETGPTVPQKFIKLTPAGSGIATMQASYGASLRILLLVCAAVLLIACANIANLLLVRGTARRGQNAMRMALGASRTRLIRQQLTEAVTLALTSGLFGLVIAYLGARTMIALAFHSATFTPISAEPSWPVLGFAFAVSLLTGIVFGVIPAWLSSHSEPAEALRGANRSTRDQSTLPQKLLVVGQAAISLALLACAGLLTMSLRNLQHQDFGFHPENRLIVSLNPTAASATQEHLTVLTHEIQERLGQLPGVESVSLALFSPMSGNNWGELIALPGKSDPKPSLENAASFDRVTANYLTTIGQPIVRGRNFQASDANGHPIAIIDQAFADRFFPGENPIGKHFGTDSARYATTFEVVGVARTAKYNGMNAPAFPMFYLPSDQHEHYDDPEAQGVEQSSHFLPNIQLLVHGGPQSLEPQIREAIGEVDPSLTVVSVRAMRQQVESNFDQARMVANLAGGFGLIALLLAAIGLYGVTAYNVTRRTAEIGVRMALGANRSSIVSMVVRGAFLQVAIGLAIGLPIALIAGHTMASQLFEVRSWDPLVLIGSIIALAACAAVASLLPARRAASTQPMKALRME